MTVSVTPMQEGEVDVLVDAVKVTGSEPTKRPGKVHNRAPGAFERTRRTIVDGRSGEVTVALSLTNPGAAAVPVADGSPQPNLPSSKPPSPRR